MSNTAPKLPPGTAPTSRLAGWALAAINSTRGGLAVAALLALSGWLLGAWPVFSAFDLALLDAKFALLSRFAPLPAGDRIAIIGIDEATLASLPEPLAMTHRSLGRTLSAVALARPQAIGVDVILPDRSYDAFAPGADEALITGLLAARRVAPVVLGITTRDDGTPRPVHPPLVAAAGAAGLAVFDPDSDGQVRRYEDRLAADGGSVPTLVGELARIAGAEPVPGVVQFALGDGFDYVPLSRVLAWSAADDRRALDAAFRDRIVLIGSVLPHEDRKRQPVRLARWETDRDVPGVLVHAQALRSLLAGAMIRPAPWPMQVALLLLAASLWLVPRWRWRVVALVAFAIAAAAVSVALLRAGVDLPVGAAARVALAATALRSALEAWQSRRERVRLKALFGGYVSPGVLDAILDDGLAEDATRGRRELAFLFADIRDFTSLSTKVAPEAVLALLNRYFAAMTPVLHEHGGTVDNFRGDGLMVIFGAPNALANPADAAVLAARALLTRLADLNRELVAEGWAPLAIGISLALGEAVVGNVGSPDRYNYTAIGDAANVAARLQDVAKSSGYPLVATCALVAQATGRATEGWAQLGRVDVRGHDPIDVAGWREG